MFEPEIEKAFSSTVQLEKRLGTLNANMSEQLPSLPSYSYYGILSPYRQQVILVDSVVFVALNHYLGSEHEAYRLNARLRPAHQNGRVHSGRYSRGYRGSGVSLHSIGE